MRHLEPLVVNLLVVVHDDVEVNGPRALVDDLLPPERILDALKLVQQCQGLKVRFDLQEPLILGRCLLTRRRQPQS